MLSESAHSASVSTPAGTVVGVLTRKDFRELTARRPDIALILYRNLAIELGAKLRSVDGTLDRISSG